MKSKTEAAVDNLLGKEDNKDNKGSGEVAEFSKILKDSWMAMSGALESMRFLKGGDLDSELKAVRTALEALVKPIENLQDKIK